jgi:dipeptidyl aminopeptidase/acylaminoacyl peptidase
MPLGIPVEFWLDARKYKPLEMIEETKKPVLVLQGERDYQVTVENFNNWNNALKNNKEADKKLYPKLNHLFLEGDSKSTPSEYMIPSHIPEYVVDDIKNWILKK